MKLGSELTFYTSELITMPRKSKSAISRIQNLESNAKKRPSVTIEDVDDEGEPYNPSPSHSNDPIDSEGNLIGVEDEPITIIGYLDDLEEEPLPDLVFENSGQEDSGLDLESDGEFEEISKVSALEKFANTLAEAQRVAVEAEDKPLKEYNRPKHYLGNSARQKRRHRQIRRELQAKGYHSVTEWFSKRKETPDEAQEPDDHEGSDERSPGGGSDSDDQVDDPDPHNINLVRVRQDL